MGTKPAIAVPICTAAITISATVAAGTAHADDLRTAVYNGVEGLRPCTHVAQDPHLAAAAQRHANDMLANGVDGHTGSDGSSPQARISDAGFFPLARSGEIVFWGTGSLATPTTAIDMWMKSPSHRAIMLDCSFTSVGFATASDGNKMTAVGDFATA